MEGVQGVAQTMQGDNGSRSVCELTTPVSHSPSPAWRRCHCERCDYVGLALPYEDSGVGVGIGELLVRPGVGVALLRVPCSSMNRQSRLGTEGGAMKANITAVRLKRGANGAFEAVSGPCRGDSAGL